MLILAHIGRGGGQRGSNLDHEINEQPLKARTLFNTIFEN